MKIIYDEEKLMEKASKIISREINFLLNRKKKLTIALAGGRAIEKFLSEFKKADIDWRKIHFFLLDERSDQSNFRTLSESLFNFLLKKGKISINNIHRPKSEGEYEKELKKHANGFDIVIASSGEDGHIASLFPNHESILSEADFFIKVEKSPKPPLERISASKNLIKRSDMGIIFFVGDAKKDALRFFTDKRIDFVECPSKLILEMQNKFIFTDIKIS